MTPSAAAAAFLPPFFGPVKACEEDIDGGRE